MSASCAFCDLIHGAAEVSVCYEDSDAIAFMDIQPVNAGHVLVVPRQHLESLFDVPPELGSHLFEVTMRVANAVRRVTNCEDMNIVVNSGQHAGQDVFHYHVHIIPRRQGDGFDIQLPFSGSEMPDRTVLDMTAARIIAALRDPMRSGERSPVSAADRPVTPLHAERVVPLGMRAGGLADVRIPAPRATQPRRVVREEGAHGELLRD